MTWCESAEADTKKTGEFPEYLKERRGWHFFAESAQVEKDE